MKKYILEIFGSFGYFLAGGIIELFCLAYLPFSGVILKLFIIALGFSAFFGLIYSLSNQLCKVEINPLFTFSHWLKNEISTKSLVASVLLQMLGGICAGVILYLLYPNQISDLAIGYGEFSMLHLSLDSVILLEFLFSFILVFCYSSGLKKYKSSRVCGLILGILLFVILLFSVPCTGGSVNPIRPFIANIFVKGDYLRQIWIYVLSPFAGSFLATILHHVFVHLNN